MKPEPDLIPAPVYPFAGQDDATRRAIDIAVLGVEDLIYKLVREAFLRADWADRDDMAQQVRVHLWNYALPRYDSTRGVKISTFLHTCIKNKIRGFFDKPTKTGRRHRLAATERLYAATEDDLHADEKSQDRAIEHLAGAIMENPERYGLTTTQGRVLRVIIEAPPGTQMKDIAVSLGYASPTSLSPILNRIKSIIADIDAAEFQMARPAGGT